MRADDPSLPISASIVRGYARRAIEEAARYATLYDYLTAELEPSASASSGSLLLIELLAEKRRRALEHAFRALAILYPRADLRSVHDAILGDDEERWSAAREILDHLIPIDLRRPLLAAMDDLSPAERRAQLGALAPGPFESYEDFVAALLADGNALQRCIVAHHVAERRLVALRPELVRLRTLGGSPYVIHAFDQAIARLDI
jgi:hypothetical protein